MGLMWTEKGTFHCHVKITLNKNKNVYITNISPEHQGRTYNHRDVLHLENCIQTGGTGKEKPTGRENENVCSAGMI